MNKYDHGYCRKHINRPLYFRKSQWLSVVMNCAECQKIRSKRVGSGSVAASAYLLAKGGF